MLRATAAWGAKMHDNSALPREALPAAVLAALVILALVPWLSVGFL